MGKILVIEGTDCSGKETQSCILLERLKRENIKVAQMSFPVYDSPTGRIIGGPFLGKEYISKGWFPETAPKVPWKVSSLFYAADRRYHIEEILEKKEKSDILILDRYTFSNMGYQVSKLETKEERLEGYKLIENLEFGLLELPRPDKVIFLHMPIEGQIIIKSRRKEALDENERDTKCNVAAETAYLEMASLYGFDVLECLENERIKTREEMHEEVYSRVKKLLP